jgi:hypothetical protein
LRADLATQDADKIDDLAILGFEQRLMALAEAIAARYFLQGANHARAEKVTGLA